MICYTSSGINLFVHICGGKIRNCSLIKTEAGCGMETKICKSSESHHKTTFNNVNNCCNNLSINSNLKIKSYEKVDKLNVLLNFQIIRTNISPILNHLLGYQNNDFDDISPHLISENLPVKNNIYLFFQNFRN